ncbi:glycosyltransferase [uncultured Thiodictyon sp.]|uniref:glycosyltransferase n=1 Tax=uncultured Thiodictyon sp. TaxID=1846217 RepID=UPI0025D7CD7D|nr:glycosyltransferase [uncultured Thiodictyon sp.]
MNSQSVDKMALPPLEAAPPGQLCTNHDLAVRLNEIQTSACWRLARPVASLERRLPATIRAFALLFELVAATLDLKLPQYLRQRHDMRAIYASGLFDANWYVQRYPDAAIAGLDPAVHYLTQGARNGYWPGPDFDPVAYIADQRQRGPAAANPLLHYLRGGGASLRELRRARALAPTPAALGEKGRDRRSGRTETGTQKKILASGLFDAEWYLSAYPDVRATNADPLFHYLTQGWREGRAPSDKFNGQIYLQCRPDVREAGWNPLEHFVLYGDPTDPSNEPFTDYCPRARRAVMAMVDRIAFLDPQLAATAASCQLSSLPCHDGHATGSLYDAWRGIFAALDRPYDRFVCVPQLSRGGADFVAIHAVRAAVERHGREGVLVLVTDSDQADAAQWLPTTATVLVVSDYASRLSADDRSRLVEILLRAVKPKAVFNVDSRACWEAIERCGKALASFCDLYVAFGSQELAPDGSSAGYADRYLRDSLPSLRKVYADHARAPEALIERFGVPTSLLPRLALVPQPIWDRLKPQGFAPAGPDGVLRVFAAGPFKQQHNLVLLAKIAALAVNTGLDVYGAAHEGDIDANALCKLADRSNRFRLMDSDACFEVIPTADYGAFLFTSLCDGLPSVILAAAAVGVPIVTCAVGGIGELIDDDTGWLIRDHNDVQCYVDALEQVRLHPQEAQRRVANLSLRVASVHSWEAYLDALSASPSFLD